MTVHDLLLLCLVYEILIKWLMNSDASPHRAEETTDAVQHSDLLKHWWV